MAMIKSCNDSSQVEMFIKMVNQSTMSTDSIFWTTKSLVKLLKDRVAHLKEKSSASKIRAVWAGLVHRRVITQHTDVCLNVNVLLLRKTEEKTLQGNR